MTTPASAPVPATNWGGNHRYRFTELLRPGSLEELQDLVAARRRVRALGSRHSFSDLADGECALDVSGVDPGIEIDPGRRRVWCGAGTTLGVLARHLEDAGFALRNLPSLPHISLAGAVSTGTHGSGDANPNLAAEVTALTLVLGSGEVRTLDAGDPDLAGAALGLGCLGVLTRLGLRIEPSFRVRQTVFETLPWDRVLGGLDPILAAGHSVSLFTDWGPAGASAWVKARDPHESAAHFHGGVPVTTPRHPVPGADPRATTEQLGVPGPWSDRLPHFRAGFTPSVGAEIQSEYHVDRAHAVGAIEAVLGCADRFRPLLLTGELRSVRRDEGWLSPQYRRDTLSLHFTWRLDEPAVRTALVDLEAALEPFDPRPHWGKLFLDRSPAGAPASSRYPRLADFLDLRERLDPDRVFTNDWCARHLDAAG